MIRNSLVAQLVRLLGLCACALQGVACGKLAFSSGAVTVSPSPIDFGQVSVGSSNPIRVSVTNGTGSPVTFSRIGISSDPLVELSSNGLLDFDCAGGPRAGSPTLAPGECARFTVTWNPQAAHAVNGLVELDSNDATTPRLTVQLIGSATVGQPLGPKLRVCLLDANGGVVATHCSDLGASPPMIPSLDFGRTPLQSPVGRTVRLSNEGAAPLTFAGAPSVQPGPTFSLSGAVSGLQLAAGGSTDLTLTANPGTAGPLHGALALATNDARDPQISLPLLVTGTIIETCIEPQESFDLGTVLLGQSNSASFTLTNCGSDDETIQALDLAPIAPTSSQFTITAGALPAVGSTLHPRDQLPLTVTYTPTSGQQDSAALNYAFANSLGTSAGTVRFQGSGSSASCGTNTAPNPSVHLNSSTAHSDLGTFTSFNPNHRPSPVGVNDWVLLDGSDSTVSSGHPGFDWQLLSHPSANAAVPTSAQGSFFYVEPNAEGDYTVQLTVRDDNGCTSSESLTFHAGPFAPGDGVAVQLTWAESCGDLDLHYLAPTGLFCDNHDASWTNPEPDWGCALAGCGHEQNPGGPYPDGMRSDDPSLGIQAGWGTGPEDLVHSAPFDSPDGAPYQVWVYYRSDAPDGQGGHPGDSCAATHPTIEVFINGASSGSYTLGSGLSPHQSWHAADVAVSRHGDQISASAASSTAEPFTLGGCQ